MKSPLYITGLLILILYSFPSFAASDKVFNASEFTLDNGLQVVVIPNHRVPVVTHMVWYKVGSADEQSGSSGAAHFLEHMMFKGSENVESGKFSTTVKSLGGRDNAFTSYDYTAYFQSISKEHLGTVMSMEADRMRGVLLGEDDLNSERSVVMEERRQVTENNPKSHFSEQLMATLFTNHPYGTPIIGWLDEIENLDRLSLKSFYDRWYAPNNAILIVSGDVTVEQVKTLANEHYGSIEDQNLPKRQWPQVPPLPGKPLLELYHPSIEQSVFTRIYRVPSYTQSKEESLSFQVLEDILSGGPATRLYQSIVVKQKLATNIGLSYNGTAISDGRLYIQVTPSEGVSMNQIETAIDKELRLLIKDGVTDEELSESKMRLQDQAVFARDSVAGPAMIVGRMMVTGTSLEDVETWPQQIESVTAQSVQEVAKQYLNPDDRLSKRPYVTGYLYPERLLDTHAANDNDNTQKTLKPQDTQPQNEAQ